RMRDRSSQNYAAITNIAITQSQPSIISDNIAVGYAFRLPSVNRCFAASVAQLALNFVPDAALALREMQRVVRPGGVVAAAVWDFRGGLVYQRLFWDTAAGVDPGAGAARDRLFSSPLAVPDGLPHLWRQAGLDAIEHGSIT